MKYDLRFEHDDSCSKTDISFHEIILDAVDDNDAVKKAKDSIKELARGFRVHYFELCQNERLVEFKL